MITHEEIRHRVENLKLWTRQGERAPHKPLLLLLSLSRLTKKLPRLATFSELEDPLKDLLSRYGPARKSLHPEYPFWRLQADGLWEVPNSDNLTPRKGNTDPLKRELLENHVEGGFSEDVHNAFDSDPAFVREIATSIAASHFPKSVGDRLLSELSLVP